MGCTKKHYLRLINNILWDYKKVPFYFLNKNCFVSDYELNYFNNVILLIIFADVIVYTNMNVIFISSVDLCIFCISLYPTSLKF